VCQITVPDSAFSRQLAGLYLAGVGGSRRAVSPSGAAGGSCPAAAVGWGCSEVCVATAHVAGR